MNAEQKRWIDNANYEQLLKRWRFADNDDIFYGDAGDYYKNVMSDMRDKVGHTEAVACSKRIGW